MQVKIIESGEIVELRVIDASSGVNWIGDLIGDLGAYGSAADGFFENEIDADGDETGIYLAESETVAWWQRVIANIEQADEMRQELIDQGLYYDNIEQINDAGASLDLEDQAPAEIAAMQAILDNAE